MAIVIAGKVTLGRSFGLMPANRGVVSPGLYRIVRHPIYLGYLITHVAFLVATPSAWNIAALLAGDAALLLRAVCEEQTLARDARYRNISSRSAGESARDCSSSRLAALARSRASSSARYLRTAAVLRAFRRRAQRFSGSP